MSAIWSLIWRLCLRECFVCSLFSRHHPVESVTPKESFKMQLKNHNRSKCSFSKDHTGGDDCKQPCEVLFLCLLPEMIFVNISWHNRNRRPTWRRYSWKTILCFSPETLAEALSWRDWDKISPVATATVHAPSPTVTCTPSSRQRTGPYLLSGMVELQPSIARLPGLPLGSYQPSILESQARVQSQLPDQPWWS